MDRFYIITNSDKDKKLEITEKIADYLKTHHKNSFLKMVRLRLLKT